MPDLINVFTPENVFVFFVIIISSWIVTTCVRDILVDMPFKDKLKKKDKDLKFYNKKRKLTATDDLVDFILMKLYEEPNEWKLDGYGWWRHKDAVRLNMRGEINGDAPGRGHVVDISGKQSRLITKATKNMMSTQILNKMMKAAVKNTA